jgi:glycosyltransferase involved in cell wall biosynthesis
MRITAIVPAIPTRPIELSRALGSIAQQTRPPDEIICRIANDRMWLGDQRNWMLAQSTGDFIATLDDDDEWYPEHLDVLQTAQEDTDADLLFAWFDVEGGTDPFPELFGRPWRNEDDWHPTTSVVLVRAALAREIGGWRSWTPDLAEPDPKFGTYPVTDLEPDENGHKPGEDVFFVKRIARAGGKIVHVPRRTWRWNHHVGQAGNPHTMGLPSRW